MWFWKMCPAVQNWRLAQSAQHLGTDHKGTEKHGLQQLRTMPSILISFKLKLPAVGNAALDKGPRGSLQLGFYLIKHLAVCYND